MTEISVREKEVNYGLSLLRVLICFEVVLCHFWVEGENATGLLKFFFLLERHAVPCFMFLSFYLCERFFREKNFSACKRRMYKLIVPMLGWAIVYFFSFKFASLMKFNIDVKISDLFWQLFTGCSRFLNPPMWFSFNLIVLTFFFLLLPSLRNYKALSIFVLIFFIALILEYSGLNKMFFEPFQYEIQIPFGRLCEMTPYACMGVICARLRLFERYKKFQWMFLVFLLIAAFLLRFPFIPPAPGFVYSQNDSILFSFFFVGGGIFSLLKKFLIKQKKLLKRQAVIHLASTACIHSFDIFSGCIYIQNSISVSVDSM